MSIAAFTILYIISIILALHSRRLFSGARISTLITFVRPYAHNHSKKCERIFVKFGLGIVP